MIGKQFERFLSVVCHCDPKPDRLEVGFLKISKEGGVVDDKQPILFRASLQFVSLETIGGNLFRQTEKVDQEGKFFTNGGYAEDCLLVDRWAVQIKPHVDGLLDRGGHDAYLETLDFWGYDVVGLEVLGQGFQSEEFVQVNKEDVFSFQVDEMVFGNRLDFIPLDLLDFEDEGEWDRELFIGGKAEDQQILLFLHVDKLHLGE